MNKPCFCALCAPCLALLLVGCGGDPLVGRWANSVTGTEGRTTTFTLDLQSSGAASATVSVTGGTCSGGYTLTGASWTSNPSNVTFTGTVSCSGSITCTSGFVFSCGVYTTAMAGVRPYSLSNSNNTLIIQSTSYTRTS